MKKCRILGAYAPDFGRRRRSFLCFFSSNLCRLVFMSHKMGAYTPDSGSFHSKTSKMGAKKHYSIFILLKLGAYLPDWQIF